MISYIRLIRFPNLIIVALTQYLLKYLVLNPAFFNRGITSQLDHFHFFLLVISTLCIAAAGYIINDILDVPIDQINKPDKMIVERIISLRRAYYYYFGTLLAGLMISLYIAWHIHDLPQVIIYPFANLLLFLYSAYWKKAFLTGNLVVSLFCAFVAGIVWYAERKGIADIQSTDQELWKKVQLLFGGYLLFAFFSTFFREIIKDLEDMEGDRAHGSKTLPVIMGEKSAKMVGQVVLLLFISLLAPMIYFNYQWKISAGLLFISIAVLCPSLYAITLLWKAGRQSDYHQLSNLAKYIMLSGILYLFFLYGTFS